ncbi:putative serine-threonine protein phosphatase [Leptomonas seymouri]|uniref:Serine/threonine-protein phosphatase n=1 Tax=Leptomonas seymouri TaxID=5684 RepID=A0A0N1I1W8_LEPSE|nr:putative serine-threonine protein phosphatase [Leptomonas seymouri]|eukprot:KPI83485.1 putative serine-threonine protein phosphatase [Leptomonas seymouri]
MNALAQTEQAEEYIGRFALRELVEEWLTRVSAECPEDPYQYLIDEATDQRRSGGGIITCPNKWCNMTMPASRFAAHQETCNNAANWVRCVRCNLRVDAAKLSQHRMFCKLERCTFCGEMVLPRMLPMCPYRNVAKAERDGQVAMHRRARRLEKELTDAVPLITCGSLNSLQSEELRSGASPPLPLPLPLPPSNSSIKRIAGTVAVAHCGAEVKPIMKTPSIASASLAQKTASGCGQSSEAEQDNENKAALSVSVAVHASSDRSKRRKKGSDKNNGGGVHASTSGAPDGSTGPSVPRPSFPAFLPSDIALQEKLKSYPDSLVTALTTIQGIWRRNMTLHLFREKVFSAVWRHMDSAQEGAAKQGKESAAIRLVERNLRSESRISAIDENGNQGCSSSSMTAVSAATTGGGSKVLSASGVNGVVKDSDLFADEEPTPSFQSDPVHISDAPLSNGGFMRVADFEALTRHCQAREVLQFSVVLRIVRAAVKLLRQRPLVQHIAIPANSSLVVVGDLHGQMKDLEYIMDYMGPPSAERYYLFNGDFVDRGPYGCEVLVFIYGLLCTYPNSVFLNRGNHENFSTNTEYGFMTELFAKYAGRASYLLDAMSDSYEVMPLLSVIDNRVAVMHGGAPRIACKLSDIEAIGHVRDIPVEQQSTRSEQLLAELLWNDPVEKFRSRQIGMDRQGEGWRSSSRGCGVEYLANITDQFLKNNDLQLIIRSHDVKTAGFELVHKNRSITVFSASNYGRVSGNRGAVAVLTKEAEQPVFHTWFLKEDYREHQQDGLLDGGIDEFLQEDRNRRRAGGGAGAPLAAAISSSKSMGADHTKDATRTTAPAAVDATASGGAATGVDSTGSAVVAAGSGSSSSNMQNAYPHSGSAQQQTKRLNASMIATAALLSNDEYICAYYLSSGGVLDEEDLMSDANSRSSAFSDIEDRSNADNTNTAKDAAAAADGASCTALVRSCTSPSKASNASGAGSATQQWSTGGGISGVRVNSGRLTASGSRGTQVSLVSHSSSNSQAAARCGISLAQDASILIQLQTLQQIRELIYFHRYALLVAFNQVDEMHTGIVYKAEWCVVMRDVLKLDIPWYYLCQFLAPRLVVDGAPSVEYMRFLRHFDACFAIDFRLSWQKAALQRISSGLDLPEDIINAFCERPTLSVSNTSSRNANATVASSTGDVGKERNTPSLQAKSSSDFHLISPLTTTMLEFPTGSEGMLPGQRTQPGQGAIEKPSSAASVQGGSDVANAADLADADEQPFMEDERWWCDVQLDFKTFAMKVRVLSPAAAAMEDNEIFALFCFFDASMQGHVYVGDMIDSITAVIDEGDSVAEAELIVSGEIDFSTVKCVGRTEERNDARQPRSPSCSSTASSSYNEVKQSTNGVSSTKTDGDDRQSGGGRSLLASKLRMIGGKPRLMRLPSSSSSEGDATAVRSSHGRNDDGVDAEKAHFASPVAPTSDADNATRFSTVPSHAPAQELLSDFDSSELIGMGEEAVDITDSASCVAPGNRIGQSHPSGPRSSVLSMQPTAIGHDSGAMESPLKVSLSSSNTNASDAGAGPLNPEAAPPALASVVSSSDAHFAPPPSHLLVLPLEHDNDETDSNEGEKTVPWRSTGQCTGTVSVSADVTLVESAPDDCVASGDLTATAAAVAPTEERTHRSFARGEGPEKDTITVGDGGRKGRSVATANCTAAAAPTSLRRDHSFNAYAESEKSASSISIPATNISKPFDDYNTNLFQLNRGNGTGRDGVDGAGLSSPFAQQLTLEQRVNKRLAMPSWVYPTLLRVQEQLLGGYMRLRFLFQALNRSRNGRLTESEFLPLMEFMNCLLEHPLSAEQAHMLFMCVHDSAINYVQLMCNRRQQRSSSLCGDGAEMASLRRTPAGTLGDRSKSTAVQDSSPGEPTPKGNGYAYHRCLNEKNRGERYIILVEFLAFFGITPVQHEDEVEALEELLYEVTGATNTVATMTASFGDVIRESCATGTDGAGPFTRTGLELDGYAAPFSNVCAAVSASSPAPVAWAASGLDSTEKHPPTATRMKGCSIAGPAVPHVADGSDMAPHPLKNDAGANAVSPRYRGYSSAADIPVPPSTGMEISASAPLPLSHPSGLLSVDGPSSGGGAPGLHHSSFRGINPRASSCVPLGSSGALNPSVAAKRKRCPRRLKSSMVTGKGLVISDGSAMCESAATPAAPTSPSVDDVVDSLLHTASAASTPIDVFKALATLGDVCGAEITLKEVLQRLTAMQQPQSSRSLPRPQEHSHTPHMPVVLGASSLISFTSNVSEANNVSDGNDTSNPQPPPPTSCNQKRPDLVQPSAPQLHGQHRSKFYGSGAVQMNTAAPTSPMSFSRTPPPAAAPQHLPPGTDNTGARPAGCYRGSGAAPEFHFASLHATLSQSGNISCRNMTISPAPVLTPPPPHTLPLGCGVNTTNNNSSFLELSMTSLSVRPYTLNQTTEQRVTVPFKAPVGPQHATHGLSSMPSFGHTNNPVMGSHWGANGTSLDYASRRGSYELLHGVAGASMPGSGPRYRQSVHGPRMAKHGAVTVLVNAASAARESELISMSLVPLLAPPAPPTRHRVMQSSSSAALSDASRPCSSAASNRDTGSSTSTTAQRSQRPSLQYQLPAEIAAAAVTGGGGDGGSSPQSNVDTADSGGADASKKDVRWSRRSSSAMPSPPTCSTAPQTWRPSSPNLVHDEEVPAVGGTNPKAEPKASMKKTPADSGTAPSQAVPPADTAAATGVHATAEPSREPSRTKAKLDSCIATANTIQSKSHLTACTSPEAPARPLANSSVGAISGGGGKPSIPAPPPLQLNYGDLHDHASVNSACSSQLTPLPNSSKAFLKPRPGETTAAEALAALMPQKPSITCSDHRGNGEGAGASMKVADQLSRKAESASSRSIASPVAPPSPTSALPIETGTVPSDACSATSTHDKDSSTALQASRTTSTTDVPTTALNASGPPLQHEREGAGRGKHPEKSSGYGPAARNALTARDSSRSKSNSKKSGANTGGRAPPGSVEKFSASPSPKAEDAATAENSSRATKRNGSPLNSESSKPCTGDTNVPNKKRSNASSDTAPYEPSGPLTPLDEKPMPCAPVQGRGKRLPPPNTRVPLKSSLATPDAMQNMYSPSLSGNGGGGGASVAAGRGGRPINVNGNSSPRTAVKSNGRGCGAASSARKPDSNTTTTAVIAQMPSTIPDKSITASARRPQPEGRGNAADSVTDAAGGSPVTAYTTCLTSHVPLGRSTSIPATPESPTKSERAPTAKSAIANRTVQGGKGRKNQLGGDGPTALRSGRIRSESEDGSQRSKDNATHPVRNFSTEPTVHPLPLPHLQAQADATLTLAVSTNTPGGDADHANLYPLPAVDRVASGGASSSMSSPDNAHHSRDVGSRLASTKSLSLLPLPYMLPSTNSASLRRESSSGAAASLMGANKSSTGSSESSDSKRAAAQELMDVKVVDEDARIVSTCPHAALSPLLHKHPILTPLGPATKQQMF